MERDLLLVYSEELADEVIKLCNEHKIGADTASQIKKSSASVFENIKEAQSTASPADIYSKFKIARRECTKTEILIDLLRSTKTINEETFKVYNDLCKRIKKMLAASCMMVKIK